MARRFVAALLGLVCALFLAAGCGDDSSGEAGTTGPASGAFPVPIEHAFGETTIEEAPSGW